MAIPQRFLRFARTYQQRCNYGSDNRNAHSTMSVEFAYRVLDLEPGASMANVKAAYRRLALKWCVAFLSSSAQFELWVFCESYCRVPFQAHL